MVELTIVFRILQEYLNSITILGSTSFLIALGILAATAFLIAERRRASALFVITMAGAALLNVTLKLSFQRARPAPFFDIKSPASYGFPSGHALASFCFYGILATLATARTMSRAGRIAMWTLAALLVALIGFSRVYLGVHYPSDVLAGYAAALVWVMVVAVVDRSLRWKERPE